MRLFHFCFASLLLAGSACLLTAQTSGGIGDPAAAPGSPSSSYALNGLDHINYYNGMMNVAIPLVTIGGRGEASRAITIPIQRQWEVTNVDGVYTPDSRQEPNLAGFYTSGYISTQSVSSDSYVCYLNDHWVAARELNPRWWRGPLYYLHRVDELRRHTNHSEGHPIKWSGARRRRE